MVEKMPYLGGSKKKENAILKWHRLKPKQRGKILQVPSVKSKHTTMGKYHASINYLMKTKR